MIRAKSSLLYEGGDIMNKLITETQKNEIEKLAEEHSEALIAYGADMYRKGTIEGAIAIAAMIAVCLSISKITKVIKKS